MRAVVQRVTKSSVSVDGEIKGAVDKGFNVLLGVMNGDTEAQAELLAAKVAKLRIFEDEDGKMNRSITDIGGEILVISQFTLCADIKKGNRPSYIHAASHELAIPLYDAFCNKLAELTGKTTKKGVFGADMQVELVNDGPVTIIVDSKLKS